MNYEAIGLIMSFVSVPLLLVGLVMLVIQAIRKKKKKSSLIVMLLSVLLFVGGFGVSLIGDPDLFPKDKAEEAKEYAETLVIGEFNPLTHENVKLVSVNFTNEDVDGNKYTFQGKVTVTDNYSDQYKGRFTVVLTYSEVTGFIVETLDIETPTRSKQAKQGAKVAPCSSIQRKTTKAVRVPEWQLQFSAAQFQCNAA